MTSPAWNVGFAKVDITPRKAVQLAGYYGARVSEGAHDPLFARATVFDNGDDRVAIVALDLIGVSDTETAALRAEIEKRAGLKPEQVMVCATHTHTGPACGSEPEYVQWMRPRVGESVADALENMWDCEVRVGSDKAEGVSFIRRYVMKDGSVVTNPGLLNPDVDHPIGEVDPQVSTLRAVRGGKTYLALVNFALHCDTVGGNLLSAGWPYFMGKVIKQALGKQADTVFLQGCCGDINHWNVFKGGHLKGFDEAERIGKAVGEAAVRAVASDQPLPVGPVGCASRKTALPVPQVSEADYQEAKAEMEKPYDSDADFTMERVLARKKVRVHERGGKPLEVEVQAFRAGDAAFVALPCEYFNALGRQIKSRSPIQHTTVVELANGSFGYIAEAHNYEEGGYETTSSIVAPGAGEQLRDTALDLLGELAK